MRGYRSQNSDRQLVNKLVSKTGLSLMIATILCVSLGAPAPEAHAASSTPLPWANGIIPSRVLLLIMLDSLEDALADDPERPAGVFATDDDPELDAAAKSLVVGYATFGVDPTLLPADALEAANTASDAGWMVATKNLGLTPALAADLKATLQSMESDLEELGS